ncbi:MAG: redox-sensing transcriptional repressor Rex [Actinobacteria bacterium]|nr:redox-sensing transcriptional repressor Rex [Actinomycetota bacterium]
MRRSIPEATVARLPLYLRALTELDPGVGFEATVSSERLAELAGVNAAKVRKDLSYLGSYGTRGVGYDVALLRFQMNVSLGLTGERAVIIAGAGRLGQALANYVGFRERGFRVVAMVDVDPAKVGSNLSGIPVLAPDEVDQLLAANDGCIVVIATPEDVAQGVVDRFVAAGASNILNFAPGVLSAPSEVMVRNVDLGLELQVLSFYAARKEGSVDS